jgi:hypothetical protein
MRLRLVIVSIIICFMLVCFLQYSIDREKEKYELLKELLYFPSGKFVKEISVGYNELFADLVWLRAVQYFGEHRLTDLKFKHLYHILDILTTLDRKFIHAYTFGGLLLEHSAGESKNADVLLHKGEFYNPLSWSIPFTRGFIYYFFRGNDKMSVMFYIRASEKPDAPDMCKRFAGFTYQRMRDKYKALELWKELYNYTENPVEKETALRYIKEMTMLIQMDTLNIALKRYISVRGGLPLTISQMVIAGYLRKEITPPWEDEYFYIDKEKRRVWCSYLDKVTSPILMRMLESNKSNNEKAIRNK